MTLPALAPLEARVLGVLIEKEHTVPDAYPLTLNSLVVGCNQKTSREPVMSASETEVQETLDRLVRLSLVVESSGGRVMRYAHNIERVLAIPAQAVALLAALMLRGPQTQAELRSGTERLHRFADISAVDGFLEELAARPAGALVVELARQPGTRETRWMQLLCGPPAPDLLAAAAPADAGGEAVTVSEIAALKANVTHLQEELSALKTAVARLCAELGTPAP
jgi:hypothetical protein